MKMTATVATVVRCVLYLRISLDQTGEGLAIERQRADCERIALARGWIIVREYIDDSISAFQRAKKRPGYDQMAADFKAGLFDAIVVWDLDRLTRQPRQLEDWIEAAEDRALSLVTANGEADLTTDAGRMFARIKAAVARQESERKGVRQTAAAKQRAEKGRPPLGVRLTGYTTAGEIIESEATTIRDIFAWFHAGDSLLGIATRLNAAGVTTRRGGKWNPSTVSGILKNPRYAGRVVYNRRANVENQSFRAVFLPIIDEGVFDAVTTRLADPRRKLNQQGTDRKHLGSSLYLCGVCEKRGVCEKLMRAQGSSQTTGVKYTRYRCTDGCTTRTAAPIDAYVIEAIRERLAKPDLADLLVGPTSAEAREAAAKIRHLRDRLSKTRQDYDDDLIDGRRYKEKTAKIQADLDAAEARQARLLAGSEVAGTLTAPDPVAHFDAAPLGIRRAVIGFLVKVYLDSVPQGRKGFSPASVRIEWKHGRPED
jgi:site-specific DNA recombinase